jgi:hypothetical protein
MQMGRRTVGRGSQSGEKMIRKLKVLGVPLVAVVASMAMVAPAALAAPGTLKSDGPFVMDGSDAGGESAFTYPGEGEGIQCPESSYAAEAVGGGAIKESGESVFQIDPIYNNAKCHTSGANNRKVTVSSNGCRYVVHIGEKTAEDVYPTTVDLACPTGKKFEFFVYSASNNENIKICTYTVEAQEGIFGPSILSETEDGDLRMEGKFEGIGVTKSGLCGAGTTGAAERDVSITFKGTKPGETKETLVSIVG